MGILQKEEPRLCDIIPYVQCLTSTGVTGSNYVFLHTISQSRSCLVDLPVPSVPWGVMFPFSFGSASSNGRALLRG